MTRQIILDTETTGLSVDQGHRLIEVGCLEMINRRMTNNRFHMYVNPQRAIDEGAMKVHGITTAFLKDKPAFDQIADSLFQFLKGAELIIHNAPFDIGFLNAEFARVNKSFAPITQHCSVIDTLLMARKVFPGQQNTLDALCRRFGVNNKHRDLHGALIDASLLSEVYLMMTGGQTQLFQVEKNEDTEAHASSANKKLKRSENMLPVIMANDAELSLHEALLDKMQKKGKCVWRDS
ncbi:MAG: DNA polymerase III subunit epsilon [Gammaproteobacteria bacterium CG_4_10_14_0_8_um_filter_38_16]|nr:MAG: DNA polymerase III subunit epsilon [Gammaproteobacteria bacterium CG_4_10_14_0_8_um_filter_38_16]PJA02954.1 MAG: DNA polymerase III subunit epsilon [Gammaproteobacteria bacterium CG_4_10_14_0_2_um_filter_38_22]PJB11380.1 MAG: DNA polymerase III subunit epsilon [Gammaproteobacteria bacterium CG_4_9_14_3_um_filter_38_9]